MKLYATMPAAFRSDDEPLLLRDLVVYEADDKPRETGLLNQYGTKIYSVRQRVKMGFVG